MSNNLTGSVLIYGAYKDKKFKI